MMVYCPEYGTYGNVKVPSTDVYDGSHAWRCIRPWHTKTLLEESRLEPESCAAEYCEHIHMYLRGDINEREMWSAITDVGRLPADHIFPRHD